MNDKQRFLLLALACAAAPWLAGCAAPAPTRDAGIDRAAVRSPSIVSRDPQKTAAIGHSSLALAPSSTLSPTAPTADAIIKIDSKTGRLSAEMARRLQGVADAATKSGNLFVRIEGYVPSGGSPAFDLLRAEENLQLIRDELQRLGVSPRRILLAPFGAEHEETLDSDRPWVEIYLIETGNSVTSDSAAAR